MEVTSPDGWAWATAEGTATLTGPGTDPHGPEVEALMDYYRIPSGSTRLGGVSVGDGVRP